MSEKPKVTTEEIARNPILGLATAGFAGGIEAQEAQGQRELTQSSQLPTDCRDDELLSELKADGVVLGEPTEGDTMFRSATLPKDWEVRATDHDMWSELVDATGKVRAMIFYKAAFYDRSAFMCKV